MTTAHHASYQTLGTEACNQCHSTGWDVALNNGGYDDHPSAALHNVQCEACHGPMGPNPATHTPNLEANLSGENCEGCHDTNGHFYTDWRTSAHGSVLDDMTEEEFVAEWGSGSCNYCHIGEGFLHTYDSDYPDDPNANGFENGAHMIGCAICHDAHDMHTSVQLRAQSTITLPFPDGFTIDGWGEGLSCGNCHHDRRTASNMTSHLTGGSAHFGPHDSPQADIVAGTGTYEIPGYSYPVTPNQHSTMLTNMCVDCHVVIEDGDPHVASSGHTFAPQVSMCQGCHASATDFNIGGVQTEVTALLDSLEDIILAGNPGMTSMEDIGDTSLSSYQAREAAWAWFKVSNDKSLGVHNRDYTMLILENSITYYNSVMAGRPSRFEWSAR